MLTWAIPTYTPAYPGYGASPALVPNVSISIMLVMSILVLIRNAVAKFAGKKLPPEESEFPEDAQTSGFTQVGRVKLFHLASFMIPCALLVVGIEYIGYMPAAFLFLLVIQFVIGSREWFQPTFVSVVAVAVMFIIMRFGFGVPVPGPQIF